jgi:hypothetical protein
MEIKRRYREAPSASAVFKRNVFNTGDLKFARK